MEFQNKAPLMFLPHFDVFCNVSLNRPRATWNLFLQQNYFQPKGVLSKVSSLHMLLSVMLNLIEASTMLHAKSLLISNYSKPYTDFKSNQKFILSIRCFEVPFRRFKTGSALTAMLSIEHSSVPRRIRKQPSSPQSSPQLFFAIQNFSPVFLSAP